MKPEEQAEKEQNDGKLMQAIFDHGAYVVTKVHHTSPTKVVGICYSLNGARDIALDDGEFKITVGDEWGDLVSVVTGSWNNRARNNFTWRSENDETFCVGNTLYGEYEGVETNYRVTWTHFYSK